MSQYFNSKVFNPEVFGKYVDRIPNVLRNELAKCGAIGTNQNAKAALSNQTGSLYAVVPYFSRISGATSQNNNGATNIVLSKTDTFEQGIIVASRMDGWNEITFAKNITAGVDFMDNVAAQISDYKMDVKQRILLNMLNGIFSMSTTGTTLRALAAKEFVENHTYDASNVSGVSPEALNKAIQKACGDNKQVFKLVIMHSIVATNLENQNLLNFLKYTDKDGVQRDLTLATWNGRLVLVDDNMPTIEVAPTYALTSDTSITAGKTYYTRSGSEGAYVYTEVETPQASELSTYYEKTAEGYTKYVSYILGEGSIICDNIGDSNPYEMDRDPKVNGGEDMLYVRDRYMCGFDGLSFIKPSSLTASASNADLADGANWQVINNGTNAIPTKSIAIARLITRG